MHGGVLGASFQLSITGLESLRLLFIPRVKWSKHLVSSCWKETEHGPANNKQARMSFNYASLSLLIEEGTLRHTKLRMYPITQYKLNFNFMLRSSWPPCFPRKSMRVS